VLRKDAQMVGLKACLMAAWKDVPKVVQWVLQMGAMLVVQKAALMVDQ
jgi:hypothetical protein